MKANFLKQLGRRGLALLLSVLLLAQAAPFVQLSAKAAETEPPASTDEAEAAPQSFRASGSVVVSIENYETGTLVLEPVWVANQGTKLNLLRAAFEQSGISNAVLEENQFDWCLDAIMNIQGIRSDEYDGSNDTGSRAWLLFQNSRYDLWDYTNWKNTPDHTVIRVMYTTNHGADLGMEGSTAGAASVVNKDELIAMIADARRDHPEQTEAIEAAEQVLMDSSAGEAEVSAAQKALTDALTGGSDPQAPALERLTITGSRKIDVNIHSNHPFQVAKEPAEAAGTVVWSVDNEELAEIGPDGILVTKGTVGEVRVTARVGLISDTVTVQIKAPATAVEITSDVTEVIEGRTVQLTARTTPDPSTDSIIWSSDHEAVAKVDSVTGVVTGIRKGTAVITASAGAQTASVEITVRDIPARELRVAPSEITLGLNRTVAVKAEVLPADTTEKLVWEVENGASILSVDQNGNITAKGSAGEAVVIVRVGGLEKRIPVHVVPIPATGIRLPEAVSLRAGQTLTLTPVLTPTDATEAVVWASDDPDTAAVENGVVTAIAPGEARITACIGDLCASTTVTVTEPFCIYFQHENGEVQKVENGTITLTPVDVGYFKVGNFQGDAEFDSDETVLTDEDQSRSSQYLVHTSGRFQPFGNSLETNFTVGAWAVADGERIDFTVNLIPSELTEIRLLVGDRVVSEDTYYQEGASHFYLRAEGRTGDGAWQKIPMEALNLHSENQQNAFVGSDGQVKPSSGTARIVAQLKCSDISTWMEASFTAVALEAFHVTVPAVCYIDRWNSLGGYYVGVQPHTGFQVSYTPANTTQKGLSWKALTPEIATYMEAFDNGIIPARAGIAEFEVSSQYDPSLKEIVRVDFRYRTPLTSVTLHQDRFVIGVSTTVALNGDVISMTPSHASEQRFDWEYSEEGIVQITETVKTDASGTASKWVEREMRGLRSGTVTVTGTPMDLTGGAKPIRFTVQVGSGGAGDLTPEHEPADVTALYQHGLAQLRKAPQSAYGDEWTIFPLLRAGVGIGESDRLLYLTSVKKVLDSDRPLQQTDYARIILTLTAMGIDARDFMGIDVTERLCNVPGFFHKTSNQLMWALLALDSHDYPIPAHAGFTRETILTELLRYQKSDGSFSLSKEDPVGGNYTDMTAMMLQALAKYQHRPEIRTAIDRAVHYLMGRMDGNCGFVNEGGENSCTAAQVITGLTAVGQDPSDPACGFVLNGGNMLTRLEVFRVPDGFALLAGGEQADLMSLQQVTYALESYRRLISGSKGLYDLTDVTVRGMGSEEADDRAVADVVIGQIDALTDGSDFHAVYAVRQHYNGLTAAQKALVTNLDKLEAAEKRLEDQKAAQRVIDRINRIGDPITLKDEGLIGLARESYDALTPEQKSLVSNYAALQAAESVMIDLLTAKRVEEMIAALPEKISVKDREAVAAAHQAYEALSAAQKELVPNEARLRKAAADLRKLSGHRGSGSEGDAERSNVIHADVVNGRISKEQFDQIKGQEKLLVIRDTMSSGKDYTMKLKGGDITEPADMAVGLFLSSPFEEEMKELAKEPVIFRFAEEGRFPGRMKIEMPVELKDGGYLLMRYSQEEMQLEKISKVQVKDGMAEFLLEEGGSYLLAKQVSTKSLKAEQPTEPAEVPSAPDEAKETETAGTVGTAEAPDRQEDGGTGGKAVTVVTSVLAAIGIGGLAAYGWAARKKRK